MAKWEVAGEYVETCNCSFICSCTGTNLAGRGLEHGLVCLRCCRALMLPLFVAGVMNLRWMAVIAGFVFGEQLAAAGQFFRRLGGVGLAVAGVAIILGGA